MKRLSPGQAPLLLLLFFILASTALFAGCGRPAAPPGANGRNSAASPPSGTAAPESSLSLPVYYLKATANGDEYLVREVHRVAPTAEPMKAALEELISGRPTTPGATRVLPPDTRILGVRVDNGLATVNFSPAVLRANVGAEAEELGILSIVDTLTEFPGVNRVAFAVNGKVDQRTRDWWGHVGLYEQPFKRDVSMVYEPAIWTTHPTPGQIAGVPLLVRGSARVPEGRVGIRLLDGAGRVLYQGVVATGKGGLNRGDFEASLKFTPPAGGQGKLELFPSRPAAGGGEEDTVTVPIRWSR